MRKIVRGQSRRMPRPTGTARPFRPLMAAAWLTVAVLGAGCASSVQTPLPDLRPSGSTAMSNQQQKQAVDELNRLRTTHEQDAARTIEESR